MKEPKIWNELGAVASGMHYLPAFALSLTKYTLCNPLENTSQRDAFDILLSVLDLNSTF